MFRTKGRAAARTGGPKRQCPRVPEAWLPSTVHRQGGSVVCPRALLPALALGGAGPSPPVTCGWPRRVPEPILAADAPVRAGSGTRRLGACRARWGLWGRDGRERAHQTACHALPRGRVRAEAGGLGVPAELGRESGVRSNLGEPARKQKQAAGAPPTHSAPASLWGVLST